MALGGSVSDERARAGRDLSEAGRRGRAQAPVSADGAGIGVEGAHEVAVAASRHERVLLRAKRRRPEVGDNRAVATLVAGRGRLDNPEAAGRAGDRERCGQFWIEPSVRRGHLHQSQAGANGGMRLFQPWHEVGWRLLPRVARSALDKPADGVLVEVDRPHRAPLGLVALAEGHEGGAVGERPGHEDTDAIGGPRPGPVDVGHVGIAAGQRHRAAGAPDRDVPYPLRAAKAAARPSDGLWVRSGGQCFLDRRIGGCRLERPLRQELPCGARRKPGAQFRRQRREHNHFSRIGAHSRSAKRELTEELMSGSAAARSAFFVIRICRSAFSDASSALAVLSGGRPRRGGCRRGPGWRGRRGRGRWWCPSARGWRGR